MEYLRYWSFREPPFGPAASRFLFKGTPQRQALAWIQDQIVSQHPVALITSPAGCGITTLFQQVAKSHGFDRDAAEVVLTNGRHPSVERVHTDLAKSMGITAKRDSLAALSHAFEMLVQRSIRPVWLIDELGKYSADAVAIATRRCPSLTTVACVTPRLERLVSRSLGKRIAKTSFSPLAEAETRAFISHSMAAAGCLREPFSDEAIVAIHQHSSGRIRQVVRISHAALLRGARQAIKQITSREIHTAAEDVRAAA